jgi:hypothetical protein
MTGAGERAEQAQAEPPPDPVPESADTSPGRHRAPEAPTEVIPVVTAADAQADADDEREAGAAPDEQAPADPGRTDGAAAPDRTGTDTASGGRTGGDSA